MVPFALLAAVVCVLHPPAGPLQSDAVDGFLTGKISDSDRFFDRFWLENWSHANYRYKFLTLLLLLLLLLLPLGVIPSTSG